MKTEQVVISAQVEQRLRDELQQVADRNDRTFSAELRRALRLHILAENAAQDGEAA